ncbi:MAG: aldo/keto reductase [Verrucomicrobia bacterium]|nr:aldo/keto reductase [Verrucomicrobiota bacterium]
MIILGTSAIGGWNWGGSDHKNDLEAIQASLDLGITHIDTAPIYGMGRSEECIATAIEGRRHEVVLATKCGLEWEGSQVWRNAKPERIAYECEESLRRLQTDYIDLYQIHWPDSLVPIEESWQAMLKLKEQGKVRRIGVCNYTLQQLKTAHEIHPVDTIQLPYSFIRRGIEEEIVPFCIQHAIAVLIYCPLERGLLTGKIAPEHQFPDSDQRSSLPEFSANVRKKIWEACQELQPIADKQGCTIAQLVLSSLRAKQWISGILVGARNRAQAIENGQAQTLLPNDMVEAIFLKQGVVL